ncbi:MAG: ImmA/IrrE family metallo-endopeptidase [Planctomycetota bacterium]
MQRRQSWVRDYLVELGADPITFVGAAELTDPISKTVDSIRGALRLDRRWAQPIKSYEDALNLLLERAEDAGLLMMTSGIVGNNTRRVLDVSEFRGFVLIDEYAPLIFTNNRDAKSAQIFTLVHEIAHVWLGSSGLFDLERTISPDMDIERHCNRVAVELLLPRDQFNEAWKQSRAQDKFREISRRFRVSRVVVARRALDSKKITKEEFFSLYEELRNEDKPVKTENDGGNFYNTAHRRLGNRFSRLVSQGVREGRLAYRDAYRLTGLRGKTFDNYMARFGA